MSRTLRGLRDSEHSSDRFVISMTKEEQRDKSGRVHFRLPGRRRSRWKGGHRCNILSRVVNLVMYSLSHLNQAEGDAQVSRSIYFSFKVKSSLSVQQPKLTTCTTSLTRSTFFYLPLTLNWFIHFKTNCLKSPLNFWIFFFLKWIELGTTLPKGQMSLNA